jgi:hypothetical protein
MNPSFTSITMILGAQVALAENQLSWAPPGPGDGMYESFVLFPIYFTFAYFAGLQRVSEYPLWIWKYMQSFFFFHISEITCILSHADFSLQKYEVLVLC